MHSQKHRTERKEQKESNNQEFLKPTKESCWLQNIANTLTATELYALRCLTVLYEFSLNKKEKTIFKTMDPKIVNMATKATHTHTHTQLGRSYSNC